MNKLIEDLQWRGLIHNSTDLEALSQRLDQGPIDLYCGFDPTADSLHLGSLQMLALMFRFHEAGHRVVALIGGATALIGDPSGKKEERVLRDKSEVSDFSVSIQTQISKLLQGKMWLANNKSWLGAMSAMEFLRDYGKYFNVNHMIKRDFVATRLATDGISFTEFSYMLFQAIDFWTLYKGINGIKCELQIGGSDQWSNMVSGLTLINALREDAKPHLLTAPLILNANGTKFGKSEKGTIWLDQNKTSSMEVFQYLINTTDEQAKVLLRQLTFLSREEIEKIEAADLSTRQMQNAVAYEVVKFIHGQEQAEDVKKKSEAIFSDLGEANPSFWIDKGISKNWEDLFLETGLVASKSEARRLASEGGLSVGNEKITDTKAIVTINGTATLKRGKSKRCVVGTKP